MELGWATCPQVGAPTEERGALALEPGLSRQSLSARWAPLWAQGWAPGERPSSARRTLSPGHPARQLCDAARLPPAVFTPRVIGTAVARYNFAARDLRELSLREGDVVKIYSRIGGDQGWWKGETNGRVSGTGPGSWAPWGLHLPEVLGKVGLWQAATTAPPCPDSVPSDCAQEVGCPQAP